MNKLVIISALLVALAKARPEANEENTSIFGGNFGFKAFKTNDAKEEKKRTERQFPVFRGSFSQAPSSQEPARFSQDLNQGPADAESERSGSAQFPVATAASLSGGFPVFQGGFEQERSSANEDLTGAPTSDPAPIAAPAPAPGPEPSSAPVAFSAVSAGIAIPLAHDQYAHMAPHTPHGYAPSVPSNTRDPNAEPLPKCAENNPKSWCLEDPEYPAGEIRRTLAYHFDDVIGMYRDVKVNTDNSVAGLYRIIEETYLCPSETSYIQPLRAINKNGQWRWIVNNIDAHYEVLTQTARIEECTTGGESCPLVPDCYETKCLQKSNYHRFLVYDRYDRYLPFAIESFKLPSSCACYNGAYSAPPVQPYKALKKA